MKTSKFKILVLLFALLVQSNIFAHDNKGKSKMHNGKMYHKSCNAIPNLTEEQEAKLKDLRLNFMKERQATMNIMREKRAHLITLQSVDKTDLSAINKTIDEITELKNKQMKSMAKQRQAVRDILTDEQKIFFDSHHQQMRGRSTMMGMKGKGNMKQGVHHNCNSREDEDDD